MEIVICDIVTEVLNFYLWLHTGKYYDSEIQIFVKFSLSAWSFELGGYFRMEWVHLYVVPNMPEDTKENFRTG